jgi:hypothetical protein
VRLNQRARIRLLAATYLDACEHDKGETAGTSKPGFREPTRSHLWREGSYWEFELALDDLREIAPKRHRWFWAVYVRRSQRLEQLAPHKRHAAEQALTFLVARTLQLARGNIYVPVDISENAGYSASEAKSARKPRARLAA